MISFFLILFPPSVNCPLLPSPIHSLSRCMQTTIPLFFFLLYFPEHSLTTHKGPCLADRSCNYLLVLTRVQRSEISISNNNGVQDAGSCMLGIWQASRLLEPAWGEENSQRGLCPREDGHGCFGFVRGKFQRIPYASWGNMMNLFSNIQAVNPASIPTHSGVPMNLRQAGDCSCHSHPPDFKLHMFSSFAKCKKHQENKSPNHAYRWGNISWTAIINSPAFSHPQ